MLTRLCVVHVLQVLAAREGRLLVRRTHPLRAGAEGRGGGSLFRRGAICARCSGCRSGCGRCAGAGAAERCEAGAPQLPAAAGAPGELAGCCGWLVQPLHGCAAPNLICNPLHLRAPASACPTHTRQLQESACKQHGMPCHMLGGVKEWNT